MPLFLIVITPFIFLFGAYRLVRLMRKLRNGTLQLNRRRSVLLPLLTVFAVFALVVCTASIVAGYGYLVWGLFLPKFPIARFLPVVGIVLAYPTIFFAAEWVFYYGFEPRAVIAPLMSNM